MIKFFFLSGGKIIEVSNNSTAKQAIKQFFDFKVLHCTILTDSSLFNEAHLKVFESLLGYDDAVDCIDYDKSYKYTYTCDLGNGDGEKPCSFMAIHKKSLLQTYKDYRMLIGIKIPEEFKILCSNSPIELPEPPPLKVILPGSIVSPFKDHS